MKYKICREGTTKANKMKIGRIVQIVSTKVGIIESEINLFLIIEIEIPVTKIRMLMIKARE